MNEYIQTMISQHGAWTYGILFAIVFSETGLVVAPFLPGDSLLFAAGMFSRPDVQDHTGGLNIFITLLALTLAPLCGDNVNYHLGKWLGPKLFRKEDSRWFNKKHLVQTHEFFERHGAKTVIIARWLPVVRTFAPFVAGMGNMPYRRFIAFSLVGAILWVWSLVGLGYWLGLQPWVQQNEAWVLLGLILITGGPVMFQFARGWIRSRRAAQKDPA